MKFLAVLIPSLLLACSSLYSQSVYDARQSVILQATVQENPPRIVLNWVLDAANGGYTIWRKGKNDATWSDSLTWVGPGSTSWTDTTVSIGVGYEYQVLKSLPAFPYGDGSPNTGSGYIYVGIKLPPVHHRGSCLLVIDSTFKQTLALEITRLATDLVNDGWKINTVYVNRNNPVPLVKSYITSWAAANPDENQALFLFGRVPVPYSGLIAPDGHHSDHRGAWPCDGYYANLDGIWTDFIVNTNIPPGTRNDNLPGDGKFDNQNYPTPVKLQVGRVDFSNMTKFSETEEQLLRRYLDKDHAWRTGQVSVMERGLVDNNFSTSLDGFGQVGWKNFSSMFGFAKVKDLPYRQTLTNQSYMWSYGCGGGGPESASDISSTTNFTTDSLQTVFTMLFGSYFGDWDYPNNFLRGAIASRSCLASTWANRPDWLFHHMALGESIGYATQVTMNNSGLYTPAFYGGWVHTGLMGDPTLRMHIQRPVENLVAHQAGQHVQLEWQDPAQTSAYFIYRKAAMDTAFQLLNQIPVTANAYIDSCAGAGLFTYLVRSMELRASASGTYYNLSQGVSASIVVDPSIYHAQAAFVPVVHFDALTLLNTSSNGVSYFWEFGDGTNSTAVQPSHLYQQPGDYTVCLTAFDGCQTDLECLDLTILSSLPNVVPSITDVVCHGGTSGAINLVLTGGAPGYVINWQGLPDTGKLVQNLLPGGYYCTITSGTGNSATYGPYWVTEPPAWELHDLITMANTIPGNGAIVLDPQGGCLPYTYLWSNGQTTPSIQNLNPGTYCVTINDCLGCTETYCGTVELGSAVNTIPGLTFSMLFPNPVKDQVFLELDFRDHQEIHMTIIDGQGKALATSTNNGKHLQITWDTTFLPSGSYWVLLECGQGLAWFSFIKM